MTKWTKVQIAEGIRKGNRSFVLKQLNGRFKDMTMKSVAYLDDAPYDVDDSKFEVVVMEHYIKREQKLEEKRRSDFEPWK